MDLTKYKNCLAHTNAVYLSTEDEPARPCCWYKGGVSAKTWDEYQEKISKEDIAKGCSHCINAEENGATWSHRIFYETQFRNTYHKKLFVIGLCVDNICNIKCLTCSPLHSTKWIEDFFKMSIQCEDDIVTRKKFYRLMQAGPSKLEFVKSCIQTLDFDKIHLDLFGGEPAINPVVLEFIDWLADSEYASRISLNFTTNGTTYIEKIDHYVERFASIAIQLSIDGVEEYYDFLRLGADWKTTSENTYKYYELAKHDFETNGASNRHFYLGINYTMSWMNSIHFSKYIEWIVDTFDKPYLVGLNLTKLIGPDFFTIDLLPQHTKEKILAITTERMNKFVTTDKNDSKYSDQIIKLIDVYKTSVLNNTGTVPTPGVKEALEHLSKLDKIRDTNHASVLTEIINEIIE